MPSKPKQQSVTHIARPKSLAGLVADQIREAIVEGRYSLGEALSENSLTETLGTSKTPVREALTLLKHEGLVNIIPQKGTFVFTMSVDDITELSTYRFALESMALDLSLINSRELLVKDLIGCQHVMASAYNNSDMREYLQLDDSFHQILFRYCNNQFLTQGYNSIRYKVAALRTHLAQHPTHTAKSSGEHESFIKLIEADDIIAAKKLMLKHVSRGDRTYADGIQDIATASRAHQTIRRGRNR